jgi:hypothetical protein
VDLSVGKSGTLEPTSPFGLGFAFDQNRFKNNEINPSTPPDEVNDRPIPHKIHSKWCPARLIPLKRNLKLLPLHEEQIQVLYLAEGQYIIGHSNRRKPK